MRSAHVFPIALLVLPALWACDMDPTVFTPESLTERDALEARLAADASDTEATSELAALYAAYLRFDEAEAALETAVHDTRQSPVGLAKLAVSYEQLGAQAEAGRRSEPDRINENDAYRFVRLADELRARAQHVSRRNRPAVRAHADRADGTTVVLDDVMLSCSNTDLTGSGALGQHLAIRYFGDRLTMSTPEGPMGSRDLEYRLAEIARLDLRTSPLGEQQTWLTPAPWSQSTPACHACLRHDPCALVGDRPEGGLDEVDLEAVHQVRFELKALRPVDAKR